MGLYGLRCVSYFDANLNFVSYRPISKAACIKRHVDKSHSFVCECARKATTKIYGTFI
jgi:hypothetical protein